MLNKTIKISLINWGYFFVLFVIRLPYCVTIKVYSFNKETQSSLIFTFSQHEKQTFYTIHDRIKDFEIRHYCFGYPYAQ